MDCDAIGNSEFTNYYLFEDETTYLKSVFSEIWVKTWVEVVSRQKYTGF